MPLTKSFSAKEYDDALESWGWLGLDGRTPKLASLFGDVFLEGADGWWYLDVIGGTVERLWADRDAMEAALAGDDGRDRLLLASLAKAAEERGMVLAPDEVYDFTINPVVGGPIELANMKPMSFVVAVNMAGQLHDQLRGVPVGTPISGISVGARRTKPKRGPASARRRWFRS